MKENKIQGGKEANSGDWKAFRAFFKKVKLSWGWIALTLLFSIAYYALTSFVPGSTAALYAGDFSMAAIMGLIINLLGTLVLSVVSALFNLMASAKSVRSSRNSVWKKMIGIRTDYYNENDPGKLLSAVTSDTETTVDFLISVIVSIPSIILYLFMCLAQVAGYNKRLLVVVFAVVPLYILYAVFMGRWQYRTGRTIQMRIGGLTGFLTERIRNLTLIKTFNTENKEETSGVETAGKLYKANLQLTYINGILGGFTFLTDAIATVLAVLWGCYLLRAGEINLEAWIAFFMFVPMINTVLRQISMMWTNIKMVQGRAARLSKIMDAPQEDMRENASSEIQPGDLVFENVKFAYEEAHPVLKDISFCIPQGKNTAIVGTSGSGKTTILKLIEQLYLPNEGTIRIGDTDAGQINLFAWRERLSYVTQDATTFSGTVKECLTYGVNRDVTDDELTQVTKLAEIYDYITELPNGFDTQLAIWGTTMSGGQRQKLVIARELLKDADILLLDEPTSALDAETAKDISDIVFRQFQGKTIITVTHELNFISGADQIVVLQDGKIAGCGRHETLMESCSSYRELVEEESYQEVYA